MYTVAPGGDDVMVTHAGAADAVAASVKARKSTANRLREKRLGIAPYLSKNCSPLKLRKVVIAREIN
jgi:hypothetical protein